MPELPEVETIRRGIEPNIKNQMVASIVVRQPQLRWKIPSNLAKKLRGQVIKQVTRRGKYLLLTTKKGSLIIHLGMSGVLRILTQMIPPNKHDHVDIEFANHIILRFTDPRRFGALLWVDDDPNQHSLLAKLGPEPLTNQFSAKYLWQQAQNRNIPIKSLIMNNKIVVGVGNIYAAEALFLAKIHPAKLAKELSQNQSYELVMAIKQILRRAIQQGGTTLKDFVNSEGKPGYFVNNLKVYGRKGKPCSLCHMPLLAMRIAQRNTMFCKHCQK